MQDKEKPWEQNQDLTCEKARKIIQENFPKLIIDCIQLLGSGWDNTTWLINENWVFRLPKHQQGATLIQNELNLLPNLGNLGIETPSPEFICINPRGYPFPIYGHRFIKGISSDKANLSDSERSMLAKPVAIFLKKLHAFPLDKAISLEIAYDQIGRLDFKNRIDKLKFQINYLSQHGLIDDAALFIDFYKHHADINVPDHTVLGHGDFYARHILLDKQKHFSAVIDWGDSELLHPAVDLAIVYQFFTIDAHSQFWQVYGAVDETTQLLAQLRAIYGCTGMGWYAHCVGDNALLNESFESLKRLARVISIA